MKYRPDFPATFTSLEAARQWARRFFTWYNNNHYHSGLGLLTPASVHQGNSQQVIQQRNGVLQTAYAQHPERFVKGKPQHPRTPAEVWINPPQEEPHPERKLQ